jgi:hypothetical protein
MAGLLAGIGMAQGLAKAFAPALGVIAIVSAGAAGAEWIEHTAPFGLRAQRDRAQAQASTNAANWRTMKADRDAWQAAEGRAEAQRKLDAEDAAKALQAAEAANVHTATAAFDQGVAFGRALTASGAVHAANPSSPPVAAPPAGGLRDSPGQDFATAWANGAYRPSASLPAEPGGAVAGRTAGAVRD